MKRKVLIQRWGLGLIFMEVFLLIAYAFGVPCKNPPFFQRALEEKKSILIILEPEIFFCPLCLEPVIHFVEKLRVHGRDCLVTGVFIWRREGREKSQKSMKIIEKKIKGFVEGNEIRFPIILDKYHVFDGLNIETPVIILLDRSQNEIHKYTLPLSQKQLGEILGLK